METPKRKNQLSKTNISKVISKEDRVIRAIFIDESS